MDGKVVISHKLYDGPWVVYLILKRKNALATVIRNFNKIKLKYISCVQRKFETIKSKVWLISEQCFAILDPASILENNFHQAFRIYKNYKNIVYWDFTIPQFSGSWKY